MRKSEKILLVISAVLTAVGAVSVFFAWMSAFLLAVGLSMGFCTVIWNCQEMCSQRIPKILARQELGSVAKSSPCERCHSNELYR